MFFDIKNFEKKYKKELENIEEWNYLRNYYREISQSATKNNAKNISLLKSLKDAFYGFKNWFRKYDYLIFSDSSERKKINGKFYDIKLDPIVEYLGTNKTLLIETPAPSHYKKSSVATKNIVSRRIIDLITVIIEKICVNKKAISLMDNMNEQFGFNYDYKKSICRFKTQYKIYKILLKIVKPTQIYLNCYYDKQYIIKAAHELGIEVIEVQHGIISSTHTAYYSILDLDKNYLPDYLLSFGKNLKEEKNTEFIFTSENVFPVGNFYLDYIKINFQKDQALFNIISKYKFAVGVSLQWTVEKELITFLKKVSVALSNILFILIPRNWDKNKYNSLKLPNNIIFYPSLDCYQVIMHCHYHCTVYSSCALEAPTLGIPNILINLNDFTKKYMSDIFNDNTYMYIVNTEKEFIEKIHKKYNFKKVEVVKSNEEQFVNNYNNNVEKIINNLKGKKDDK